MLPRTRCGSSRSACSAIALAAVSVFAVLNVAPASAQTAWTGAGPYQRGRLLHAAAYDTRRAVTVLFGGRGSSGTLGDTVEWDGTSWRVLPAMPGPRPRMQAAMAFDAARGHTVLFGGGDGRDAYDDMWAYDGCCWRELTPATRPSARRDHAMVWDSLRQRIVLCGGIDGRSYLVSDTWEWDGTSWIQIAIPSPEPRSGPTMAFDEARGVSLLFGAGSSFESNELWRYDGASWLRVATSGPTPRRDAAIVYDAARNVVVLSGGSNSGGPQRDSWLWDGTAWRAAFPLWQPVAAHELCYDAARQRVVQTGGGQIGSSYLSSFVSEWNGSTWSGLPGPEPTPRAYTAMCRGPGAGEIVLYGGLTPSGQLDDLWIRSGDRWRSASSVLTPSFRVGHEMAFDSLRSRSVMFGGADSSLRGLVWEWDGTAWHRIAPAIHPEARGTLRYHAMVFDAVRQRVMLFGGSVGSAVTNDTWEWDGQDWRLVLPTLRPPSRERHAMAFDSHRGRAVLFGGQNSSTVFDDTWEWDGVDWARRPTQSNPPPARGHSMCYDEARRRTVLLTQGPGALRHTWEWNGVDWALRDGDSTPPSAEYAAIEYDPVSRTTIAAGGLGYSGAPNPSGTWIYGPIEPARYDRHGTGCAGSAGVAELAPRDLDLPWAADFFELEVTGIPSGGVATGLIGFSRTQAMHLLLPFDLGSIGMPGCWLLCSADLASPLTPDAGRARWDLAMPAVIGAELFVQAAILDATANAVGVIVSDAGALRIGGS